MTPLERIKIGILKNDMEEVIQGYMALTGEEVRPEDGVSEVREPSSLPVQKAGELDFSTKPTKSQGKKRLATKAPVQASQNTFVDDGVEHTDIKTPDYKPTLRSRAEATMVDVTCHVCKKEYEVAPVLAQGEFYRCDSCVGGK